MKIILKWLIIVVIILSFVTSYLLIGCKETDATTEETDATTEETDATAEETDATAEEEPDKVVAETEETYVMITFVSGVPYWIEARWGFEDAAEAFGVIAEYTGPNDIDPVSESQFVDNVITRGVKGIAIAVADPKALNPAIERAVAAGIPVVNFADVAEDSEAFIYIGASGYEIAERNMEELAKLVDYKGKIGVTYGAGVPVEETGLQAIKDVIAKYPDLELAQVVDDKFDYNIGVQAVSAMIAAIPDLAGISAIDATGGACIAAALKEGGYDPGDIKAVVVETYNDTLDAIRDGWVDMSIVTNTYAQGYFSLVALYLHNHMEEMMPKVLPKLAGGYSPFPVDMNSGNFIIDKSNYEVFYKE